MVRFSYSTVKWNKECVKCVNIDINCDWMLLLNVVYRSNVEIYLRVQQLQSTVHLFNCCFDDRLNLKVQGIWRLGFMSANTPHVHAFISSSCINFNICCCFCTCCGSQAQSWSTCTKRRSSFQSLSTSEACRRKISDTQIIKEVLLEGSNLLELMPLLANY